MSIENFIREPSVRRRNQCKGKNSTNLKKVLYNLQSPTFMSGEEMLACCPLFQFVPLQEEPQPRFQFPEERFCPGNKSIFSRVLTYLLFQTKYPTFVARSLLGYSAVPIQISAVSIVKIIHVKKPFFLSLSLFF